MSVQPATNAPRAECGVCEEPYAQNRRPFMKTCGHSFCEQCLANIVKSECPWDRQPWIGSAVLNRDLLDVIDPGKTISRMVSQVKELAAAVRPTMAQLPEEESQWNNFVKSLIHTNDGCPQYVNWGDYPHGLDFYDGIINNSQDEDDRTHAHFMKGILAWAMRGHCRQEMPRGLFTIVAESDYAARDDRVYARFAWAYLELNRDDFSPIQYRKVRRWFELVENSDLALPVHRSLARFYLTCFHLKGLGDVQLSHYLAHAGFKDLVDDRFLPAAQKAFAYLMLGEIFMLGLGRCRRSPSFAKDFFQLATSLTHEGRLKAKANYWLGFIHKNGMSGELPPSSTKPTEYLSSACTAVGRHRADFSAMKLSLEEEFRLGDRYPASPSQFFEKRGAPL